MLIWVNGAWITWLVGWENHVMALNVLKLAWVVTPPFFAFLYYLAVILINREKENSLLTQNVFTLGIGLGLLVGFTDWIVKNYTIVNPIIVNIGYGGINYKLVQVITFSRDNT